MNALDYDLTCGLCDEKLLQIGWMQWTCKNCGTDYSIGRKIIHNTKMSKSLLIAKIH